MGRLKVLVLGGSGMLGAMVVDTFSRAPGVDVAATVRDESLLARWRAYYPSVSWSTLDAERSTEGEVVSAVRGCSWVVNSIGVHDQFKRIVEKKDMFNMLNLNSILIGTKQPKVLAGFYEKALGKPADMVDENFGFYGWQVGAAYLSVLDHSEMGGRTKDPGRVMINFETSHVKEEFERIKALGGTVIKEPYELEGGWIATLADPDGNYFQLVSPMG